MLTRVVRAALQRLPTAFAAPRCPHARPASSSLSPPKTVIVVERKFGGARRTTASAVSGTYVKTVSRLPPVDEPRVYKRRHCVALKS